MGKKAQRIFQIIHAAQNGIPLEAIKPPLNKDEIERYESVVKETAMWRSKGIKIAYDLPSGAYDDDDDDYDIYSEDFDEEVMEEVEKMNKKQNKKKRKKSS